jgi:ATP-dependent exoDNAse (exonuclease V) beta subunit
MILGALEDYCLGYSTADTAARLKKKTNRTVSASTISNWLAEYHRYCTYLRLREHSRKRFPPAQTIRSIKLYHRQIYAFSFHRAKLELLRDGTLDDKRTGTDAATSRFAPLANFLEAVPVICPHDLFTAKDDKARASQARPAFADVSRTIVNRKENAATDTAAFIIPAVGNNKLRHESLQRFMLATDSVTIAIEIPIWLTETDIAALECQYGIELAPRDGDKPRSITGHIDFLQVRNGAVHILDYKPDARTNTPIAQLTIYALALTRLVPGLKLFEIKCAWFNEEEYNEFFPRTLFAPRR